MGVERWRPSSIVALTAFACATTPPAFRAKPTKNQAPVLIISKSLGPDQEAQAYGSGLPENLVIQNLTLSPGHSQNTITLSATVAMPQTNWSMVSAGSLSSSLPDPSSEFWRQGQFQITSRPLSIPTDEYGRFMPVTDSRLSLELDLGTRRLPKYRRDTAIVSLQGHPRGPSGQAFRVETNGGVFGVARVLGRKRMYGIRTGIDVNTLRPRPEGAPHKPEVLYARDLGVLAQTSTAVQVVPTTRRRSGRLLVLSATTAKSYLGLPAGPWLKSADFASASRALIKQFKSQKLIGKNSKNRRAVFRDILQIGPPKIGHLLSRDAGAHIVFEEWMLPTASGTKGMMLLAKPTQVQGKLPVMVYLCGHFQGGIRHPQVRKLLREAVRKGFMVAAVDLLGFGYRVGPSAAHIYASYLTLLGQSGLRVFVEEAETALETIQSMPMVDLERIGVSGISLGGSLAVILGALRDDVAAIAAMAGTPSFAAYAQPIGSDSEQHSWRFQAFGGFEAMPALIAPRKFSLIMAQEDLEHGPKSSQPVVDAARRAYAKSPDRFRFVQGQGMHDQKAAARKDIVDAMAVMLEPNPALHVDVNAWLPPASPLQGTFFGLREVTHAAHDRAKLTRSADWEIEVRAWSGSAIRLGETGPKQTLWALPTDDDGVHTMLWHFAVPGSEVRIMMIDDAGRMGAAFAPILQGCGIDVSVFQARSFGTGGAWHQAWYRKLLSLASASLDAPLAKVWMNDLATAIKHIGNVSAVLVAGPESGAMSILAASAGTFGDVPLILAEAPESLSARLTDGLPPYWSVMMPGLLRDTDLDLLAQKHAQKGQLTLVNGGASLGLPTADMKDPVSNRAMAVGRLLALYSMKTCMKKIPVVSVNKSEPWAFGSRQLDE
jgi:dienelactone hydrolase